MQHMSEWVLDRVYLGFQMVDEWAETMERLGKRVVVRPNGMETKPRDHMVSIVETVNAGNC